MNTPLLLKKPKDTPKIVSRVSKIDRINLISEETKKSSIKLRKIFEKGTYQKKIQTNTIKKYKKRISLLEKEEEDRRKKLGKRTKRKIEFPKIKPFSGNFFSKGSTDNPLKAIGLLAAFNAVDKANQKDFSGSLGPALIASGIFLTPAILPLLFRSGRKPSASSLPTASTSLKKPPILNPSSLSRANQSYARFIAKDANIGDRLRLVRRGYITPRQSVSRGGPQALANTQPGRVSRAFARFGGSIIPGVGAIVGATDSVLRAQSGDITGSGIAGTAAALDAFAAASAATGVGVPLAGLASIASFTLDVTNLIRDLTGLSAAEEEKNKSKLKEQTKSQKKLVESQKEDRQKLSFSKTLNSYEKAVNKFEEFSKNFKAPKEIVSELTEGGPPTPPTTGPGASNPYTGPIDKDSFFPLPGGILSTAAVNVPLGEYGAQRGYPGGHSGQDIGGLPGNSPVVAWKTGTVTVEPGLEGPDNIITIDHGNGVYTKYKHVIADVKSGDIVYGGQQIARLLPGKQEVRGRMYDTHLHFEVWRNGRHINPNPDISTSQKISSPLSKLRAEEQHKKTSQPQVQPQSPQQLSKELFQDPESIQRSLSGKELTIQVGGKNYIVKFDSNGLEVFKPRNLIGYQEEIDISRGKNTAIKKAVLEKIRSMYPAVPRSQQEISPQSLVPQSNSFEVSKITSPQKSYNISQALPYEEFGFPDDPIFVPTMIPAPQPSSTKPFDSGRSIIISSNNTEYAVNSYHRKMFLNTLV